MKKAIVALSVLFLISGCGEDTKNLTCTSKNTTAYLNTTTTYDIDYANDKAKYVKITYDHKKNDTTTGNDVDGVNADSDGITENKNTDNNKATTSDEVIDGAVGDAIDTTIDGVKDTILDIAGIKSNYESQLSAYDNIEGFSYSVDQDTNDEYKIVYKIDMDKISDDNLAKFNLDRDLNTIKTDYENKGYTCK